MATKWKNTTEKLEKAILTKTGRNVTAGIFFLLIAIGFFYNMLNKMRWLDTNRLILLNISGSFFLSLAIRLFYRLYLNAAYVKHLEVGGETYESWKYFYRRQRTRLCIAEAALALASYICSFFIFEDIRYFDYDYWRNMHPGYIAFLTAILLIAACEIILSRFMHQKLDTSMDNVQKINQEIVDASIASEKESIDAAIKSEKLKVDLISNVSHDLKTPLTSMVGYIDLMKKEELGEVMADYVEVLSTKAEKLKEMIESLFSLAKTSSGNIELHPEPLYLNRLIEQIYADMEDKISASGLEFVTELTAADTELITDSSYLYRICQNLIENALKYSAMHTRVFLKTMSTSTENGRLIRFEITNTSGYRMDFTKEQIVERFARGDKARSSEGNGLGLAIVSTYTSALGGRFDVMLDCDQFKAIVEFEKISEQLPAIEP